MPRDKMASHIKILQAAREEFLEYGYEKASMRRIGDRCGMTAAALYRHCKDKADLFSQVVKPAIERIDAFLTAHRARGYDALEHEIKGLFSESEINMMMDVVYPNMEDYRLLLTCAQGSGYENYLHSLVEQAEEDMMKVMSILREKGYPAKDVSREQMHILLSAYTAAMFEPVLHNFSTEEAVRCVRTLEAFFIPGWKLLMGFQVRDEETDK
jgi:AcrR family transcriptional regulator